MRCCLPTAGWLGVQIAEDREVASYQVIDLATTEVVAERPRIYILNEKIAAISRHGLYLLAGRQFAGPDDFWEVIAGSGSFKSRFALLPMRVRGRIRWPIWDDCVHSTAFTEDGTSLAMAGGDGVTIACAPWRRFARTELLPCGGRSHLAFHPVRPFLAAYDPERIEIWSLLDRAIVARAAGTDVCELRFSRDGRLLACGHRDGTVRVLNTGAIR